MTLEKLTAQHNTLFAARFRGVRTVEIDGRRTLSNGSKLVPRCHKTQRILISRMKQEAALVR